MRVINLWWGIFQGGRQRRTNFQLASRGHPPSPRPPTPPHTHKLALVTKILLYFLVRSLYSQEKQVGHELMQLLRPSIQFCNLKVAKPQIIKIFLKYQLPCFHNIGLKNLHDLLLVIYHQTNMSSSIHQAKYFNTQYKLFTN